MSKLSESIGKKFTITTELMPPRGPDTTDLDEKIEFLSKLDGITAVNVIDSPSARLLMSSLGVSIKLLQAGVEPIFQIVCRDRNTLALEADLLSAQAFDIENVLALTGDHPVRGPSNHSFAKPVYELDSTSLLATIDKMNAGYALCETELNGKCNFFAGAAISPSVKPMEPEVLKVRRKFGAGAKFFQTQPIFEVEAFSVFMELVDEVAPNQRKNILVGLIPLASQKQIDFLNRLPGISVDEKSSKRVVQSNDSVSEGIDLCRELIDEIKSLGLGGAHIMPVGRLNSLEKIIE